jgi:7-cyano-7-deazaguanine tRNA-ribosyltransferase
LFEIIAEDHLGRIGRLRTRGGRVAETPLFLPVINPVTQDVPAGWMRENLGAEAVITNAYILLRRLRDEALRKGVHGVLGFDGVVMTDSGGYQVLEYGGVEASPEEIAELQEEIGSDIAVPLDIPTGLCSREKAEESVERTLRNLEATIEFLRRRGVRRCLWAAPIQGGIHLDLVHRCANKEREMGFDLYALGSPTPLMEEYRFDKLFQMIYAARSAVGFGEPLHLFGAGHPMIFSFIVALGVDMFDSASYILYARDDRYMTETGTIRVEKLDYLPCCCPICSKMSAAELKQLPRNERIRMLAMHNLHICFMEVRRVKQAIRDGRLMELLEQRARSHPSLYQGFIEIMQNEDLLRLMEENAPISGRRGVNLYDEMSLRRPLVRATRRRLLENCLAGRGRGGEALLLPETLKLSLEKASRLPENLDILFYGSPYGLIPLGLRYTYPLSQTNYPKALLDECLDELIAEAIKQFEAAGYKGAYILKPETRRLEIFEKELARRLRELGVEVRELESLKELMSGSGGGAGRNV